MRGGTPLLLLNQMVLAHVNAGVVTERLEPVRAAGLAVVAGGDVATMRRDARARGRVTLVATAGS